MAVAPFLDPLVEVDQPFCDEASVGVLAIRRDQDVLDARIGDVLLFPIYRKLSGTGTGAKYQIVGWAGFRLSGLDLHGTNEILLGEFVSVTWDGIQAEKASDAPPDFGVTNVSLVE